jgi:hypothetical protein
LTHDAFRNRAFLAAEEKSPSFGQRADGERVMVRVRTKILSLLRSLIEYQRLLTSRMFDTYRPEQHYMRGPGPRWHEKHGAPQV